MIVDLHIHADIQHTRPVIDGGGGGGGGDVLLLLVRRERIDWLFFWVLGRPPRHVDCERRCLQLSLAVLLDYTHIRIALSIKLIFRAE